MKVHETHIIIGGLIALLLVAALPVYYDTGDAYDVITKERGIDVFQRIKAHAPACTDDGVGTNFMPFGTSVSYCGHHWFILFNTIPFQTSGGEIPPPPMKRVSWRHSLFPNSI